AATHNSSTAPPMIRGRLLPAAFFGFLRRLRGTGRSYSSSSRSSSSAGGGAALRDRGAPAFRASARPFARGTGKADSHFGHLIIFPGARVSATLRVASHDGQTSFLVNIVFHKALSKGWHRVQESRPPYCCRSRTTSATMKWAISVGGLPKDA